MADKFLNENGLRMVKDYIDTHAVPTNLVIEVDQTNPHRLHVTFEGGLPPDAETEEF